MSVGRWPSMFILAPNANGDDTGVAGDDDVSDEARLGGDVGWLDMGDPSSTFPATVGRCSAPGCALTCLGDTRPSAPARGAAPGGDVRFIAAAMSVPGLPPRETGVPTDDGDAAPLLAPPPAGAPRPSSDGPRVRLRNDSRRMGDADAHESPRSAPSLRSSSQSELALPVASALDKDLGDAHAAESRELDDVNEARGLNTLATAGVGDDPRGLDADGPLAAADVGDCDDATPAVGDDGPLAPDTGSRRPAGRRSATTSSATCSDVRTVFISETALFFSCILWRFAAPPDKSSLEELHDADSTSSRRVSSSSSRRSSSTSAETEWRRHASNKGATSWTATRTSGSASSWSASIAR